MKKLLIGLLLFCSTMCFDSLLSQNEFGTVGSYWLYSVEPHNGNGYGWEKIKVTKDTTIDDKVYKMLTRTYYRATTYPPIEEQQGEFFFGFMNVENDSVFINDQPIFDFGAEAGDTIDVLAGFDFTVEISLVIDSVTIENIDNIDYKKYYGNKFCTATYDDYPYQEFQAIETIGGVAQDYFTWNADGCILGGGTATLTCFRNGNFVYPESSDCEERFLSAIEYQSINSFKVYPNPANEELFIDHDESIEGYTILGLDGSVVSYSTNTPKGISSIDINELKSGVYFVKVISKGKIFVSRFIKN